MSRIRIFILFSMVVGTVCIPLQVRAADICWPTRSIDQHRCVASLNSCVGWVATCTGIGPGGVGPDKESARRDCEALCFKDQNSVYPGGVCSDPYCRSYSSPSICQNEAFTVACTNAPVCEAIVTISNCEGQMSGTQCVDLPSQNLTYGCWGPGPASPTPTPGGPTPGPTNAPLCPNSSCDIEETCSNCPADCNACPTPAPGTLTARAIQIDEMNNNCINVPASTNYLTGTTISFNPAVSPASQPQGSDILSWTNVITNGSTVYTVLANPPEARSPGVICVSQNGGAWSQNASANLTNGGTNSYAIAFLPQTGWFQTSVGNVYAAGQLTSSIPSSATTPYFSLGVSPGIVSYGTGYDFSLTSANKGEAQVSSPGWLVQQTSSPINYYERFTQKLISDTKTSLTEHLDALPQPTRATSPCIFTVEGNLVTAPSSPWTIGADEKMIVLVNGNVTINSPITIASGGFFSLIVNGNITVNPSVGSVDGIYITSSILPS